MVDLSCQSVDEVGDQRKTGVWSTGTGGMLSQLMGHFNVSHSPLMRIECEMVVGLSAFYHALRIPPTYAGHATPAFPYKRNMGWRQWRAAFCGVAKANTGRGQGPFGWEGG